VKLDSLFIVGFFAAFFAFIAGAELYNRARRKRLTAEWTAFVERRGWRFLGTYPMFEVHGTLQGVAVSLLHTEHISGKGARSYTHEYIARPVTDLGSLAVRSRGMLDRLLPGASLRSGDPAFDQKFIISNEQPGALRAAGREALLAVPEAAIFQGAVHVTRYGMAEPKNAADLFLVVATIASAIDR
jgi:hypothetical protein